MRRQILLASVGAIAIAGSAFAADLPYRGPPPVYLPPPPIFTWTGIYVGGQVGYAWGTDPIDENNFVFPAANAFFNDKPNGVIGGAHAGYNLQFPGWNWFSSSGIVIGLEGTVDGSSLTGTRTSASGVTISTRTETQGSIRGRLGLAWDRVLIYGTGGAAFAGVDDNYRTAFGAPFAVDEQDSKTRTGWTAGGGIDYAITPNWSIGVEYRYSDFGRSTDYPAVVVGTVTTDGNVAFTHHIKENQVQARFTYLFSTPPAPVVAKY
jgi:outer membrane immunogenic protein